MFYYNGNNHHLRACVVEANYLVKHSDKFYEDIEDLVFDMSTATGEHIVSELKESTYCYLWNEDTDEEEKFACNQIEVVTYKPLWRFSKAIAYFDKSQSNKIFLNKYKLDRSKGSIVGTLIHEWIHYVDNLDFEHSYGHGDNSANGKQNTAPYYIGNLASSYVDYEDDFNNTENQAIKTYTSIHRRVFNFFKRVFK